MNLQFFFPFIMGLFFIFQDLFANTVEESFLLINGHTKEPVVMKGPYINDRISPCSTFKITLGLMGYDAGILIDESMPVWVFQEGYDDYLDSWKAPQYPASWMKFSCLWYSKILALEIGLDKIQNYLESFAYGNQDVSVGLAPPGSTSIAWINSSLKISPKEQVDFIQKMVSGKLGVSPEAFQMTKTILFKEKLCAGWSLFGKTGWSGSSVAKDGITKEHGWFVGWIEKEDKFYPFAYLIRDKKINLPERVPRVKELLMQSGIMIEL
ncbi:MAG TPA: penicillin-binding transpeptidase domain-containing protein [Parachlamydiaceae bacterium]|nr:penicillin-binding transpeptidase domain-containing protein [Parachlamydiaceae bacterium]